MAKVHCVLVLQTPSDDVTVEQPGNAIVSEWVGGFPLSSTVLVEPGKSHFLHPSFYWQNRTLVLHQGVLILVWCDITRTIENVFLLMS